MHISLIKKNTDLNNIHTITFFSDGCGGQNNNQTVLGMLSNLFHTKAPSHIKAIVLIYPVVGHSYILPDPYLVDWRKNFLLKTL